MALPQYDQLKQASDQRIQAQGDQQSDAIKRRFAAMGNLNSGAYVKQQDLQNADIGQQKESANSAIDIAGAGEEQRRKEVGDAMNFQSGEAQKGRDFAGGESKLARDLQSSQFDKSFKQQNDQFDKSFTQNQQGQEFNMGLAQQQARNPGGLVQGVLGKGGVFGTVGSVFGMGGGGGGGLGGSLFCTEMRDKKYISHREFLRLTPLLKRTIWTRPEFLEFYLTIAPKVLDVTRANDFDWTTSKNFLLQQVLADLEEGFLLSAQLRYMNLVKRVCFANKETKHLWDEDILRTTMKKRVVAFIKLLKREEIRNLISEKIFNGGIKWRTLLSQSNKA